MLTKEQILKAKDYDIEEMEVPEWGGSIYLRAMTGMNRDRFEHVAMKMVGDSENMIGVRARLAAWSICDADGNFLFTDEDAEELGKKNGAVLDRIFERAQKINRITEAEVVELEKKSESAQG